MLNRGLLSLVLLVLGLNAIYFGCVESGADNYRNPLWAPMSTFIEIEKLILYGVAAIVCANLSWRIMGKLQSLIDRYQDSKRPVPKCIVPENVWYANEIVPRPDPPRVRPNAIYSEPKVQAEKPERITETTLREDKLIPEKPKPTASELKQKALADILGR